MTAILRTLLLVALVVPATAATSWLFWQVTMWQYREAPWLLVGSAVMLAAAVVGALFGRD